MSTEAKVESHVFHRRLREPLPWAVAADGSWLIDATGKRYLDASGGAMVAVLGHELDDVAEAVAAEIRTLGYVSGLQFTHRAVEELADELAAVLPPPLEVSYFLASGSEAIEAAVKLARQIQVERGEPGRWKVISRVPSYHGNTLAALALSGREHYRRTYGPLLLDLPRIPAPDPYRNPQGPGSTGEALVAEIERQGPETVAAFLYEPIGGSSSGAAVPTSEYVETIFAACRAHGVLVIADEIVSAMGRTGRWLACEHFGTNLMPDIVVLGKGLNAGALPLSAVVTRRQHLELLRRGSGAFNHAQTYSHHPATCAAGLATVRRLRREGLVEAVTRREARFFSALAPVRESRLVGDLRGRGFLAGVELVADRTRKVPFARGTRVAELVTAAAFDRGLLVWPNVGHLDDGRGDLLMLAPPFTASDEELDRIGELLAAALGDVANELGEEGR